jgi:hypothetical protein
MAAIKNLIADEWATLIGAHERLQKAWLVSDTDHLSAI